MTQSLKRYTYRGELARPLKPSEAAELKLPLLHSDLGATSDRDAVCKMLDRHVIGKNVRRSKKRAREDRAFTAEIRDLFEERHAENPSKSRKQIAYMLADEQEGVDPFWILEVCKPAKVKRDDARDNKNHAKQCRVLAPPLVKRAAKHSQSAP